MEQNRILPVIAIVVPCYNEQEALPLSYPVMRKVIDTLVGEGLASADSYILCSNDGSKDDTWGVIKRLHASDPLLRGISLAHNKGHQYALLAGLMAAHDHCDAAVSIDADLQDDPMAIVEMVRAYRNGADIVYGVRSSRKSDTWFKRTSAHAFYSFQRRMGLQTIYDHADFRLMSNKALGMLSQFHEQNLFLRGIIPQIGLRTEVVYYERNPRVAGESKYPLSKMLSFSIDGITSFSSKPLRYITLLGVIFLLVDVVVAIYVLHAYFYGQVTPGWASIMMSIWFVGGATLVCLGIVGEYISKIFIEVKARPRFQIDEDLW